MKLRLVIDMELPDEISDYSDAELRQLVFDAYINYNTCSHLADSVEWLARSQQSPDNAAAPRIYKHHDTWGDISRNVKWSIER